MKVRELIEKLQKIDNKDAEIYIEADHGQSPEMADNILFLEKIDEKLPYYGDYLEWECDMSIIKNISAVLISY